MTTPAGREKTGTRRARGDARAAAAPVRPFLKWAGGKLRVIERIRATLPAGRRLVEPFAGSAAVSLNTDYDAYLLADSNPHLIELYRVLQRRGPAFVEACRAFFGATHNDPEVYYRLREEFNNPATDPERRAALFVYLNRHGYNGLCRYNASGLFNVPFGRYKRPYFPEREMLAFHARADRAEFLCADFETVMTATVAGDVVYCDPPYVPLSASASFTAYSAGGFSAADQGRLARVAGECAARGVPVLISNHDRPEVRRAYRDARLEDFPVRRFISCNGSKRGHARELLALFGPADGQPRVNGNKTRNAPLKTSELVYSGPSPIHGTGLFARIPIEEGTHIGTYRGPEARRDGTYVLWVDEGDGWVGRSGRNVLRYTNHSDDPNAEFDGFDLYARRAIAADEEITFNYEGD